MGNRLAKETSPYLLQHRNNPIDWWPYCREALDEAKKQGKLIFISIGYSSCHWCHVMARESFEDNEVANFLNKHFISIKVDREEYPGVDKIYQELYQIVNRRGGGWPLSVWLTPDGKPIFLGTYFPNRPKHGLPSFLQLCQKIVDIWNTERKNVIQQANAIASGIDKLNEFILSDSNEFIEENNTIIVQKISNAFDWENGGIGHAPKFPHIPLLRFILNYSIQTRNEKLFSFVLLSFNKMSEGGIYDQLKGGVSRYSVDSEWLVPHFEKMLYDNAEFLKLGTELYSLTKDHQIKSRILQTLDWIWDEMTAPEGAFYASLNAESENREGKYYVWHVDEITELINRKALTPEEATVLTSYFGITPKGNFSDPHHPEITGMNILHVSTTISELAKLVQKSEEDTSIMLRKGMATLLNEREKRIKPDRDNKIITGWNALMISSLIAVGESLGDEKFVGKALHALRYMISHVVEADRILRIVPKHQDARKIEGILEDYAFLAKSCIDAYEHTGDWEYIRQAMKIYRVAENKFFDATNNVFYINSSENEELDNGRVIDFSDTSIPSGTSVMLQVMFKIAKYSMIDPLERKANKVYENISRKAMSMPTAMGEFFLTRDLFTQNAKEIVQVLDGELNNKYLKYYLPMRLIYRWKPNAGLPNWPILEGKTKVSTQTLYICENQTCSLPIISEEQLDNHLKSPFDKGKQ